MADVRARYPSPTISSGCILRPNDRFLHKVSKIEGREGERERERERGGERERERETERETGHYSIRIYSLSQQQCMPPPFSLPVEVIFFFLPFFQCGILMRPDDGGRMTINFSRQVRSARDRGSEGKMYFGLLGGFTYFTVVNSMLKGSYNMLPRTKYTVFYENVNAGQYRLKSQFFDSSNKTASKGKMDRVEDYPFLKV